MSANFNTSLEIKSYSDTFVGEINNVNLSDTLPTKTYDELIELGYKWATDKKVDLYELKKKLYLKHSSLLKPCLGKK